MHMRNGIDVFSTIICSLSMFAPPPHKPDRLVCRSSRLSDMAHFYQEGLSSLSHHTDLLRPLFGC
jgi:hypothetical protein